LGIRRFARCVEQQLLQQLWGGEKANVANNTLDHRFFDFEISCEIAAEKRKKALRRGGK
jgi:hypothetical protein